MNDDAKIYTVLLTISLVAVIFAITLQFVELKTLYFTEPTPSVVSGPRSGGPSGSAMPTPAQAGGQATSKAGAATGAGAAPGAPAGGQAPKGAGGNKPAGPGGPMGVPK